MLASTNSDRSTVKHAFQSILKMIVTSGFLTALECTKFVFGRGLRRSPIPPIAGLRRILLQM